MFGPPSSHPARRVAVAFAVAVAASSLVACTSSGTTATTSSSEAPAATSGSGSATSAKSPATKAPSSSTKTTETVTRTTEATDSTEVADPGSLPPACELLPEDDVVEAFGEPVVAGDQRQDECWWSTKNDLKTVNLIRRTDQDVDEWRSGYQNSSWRKIDLFDEAYAGKALDSITFRIGTTTYEVNVIYSTKGDPEQVVQDLTDKVVARL
jgi:hypothetical protein